MKETQKRIRALEEENHRLRAELDETYRGIVALTNELEEANENLQKQAEQQQALLSSIPAHVYFKDRRLNYITANKSMVDMLEIGVDEFAGKTDYDFFPQKQAEFYRALDRRLMETGQAIYNLEESYTAPDGQTRWVLATKVPFRNAAGTVIGIVGALMDITERKQMEESLLASETRITSLLTAIPDLVLRLSRDGIFLDYHAGNPKDLFLPPEQFLGKSIMEMMPPALAQQTMHAAEMTFQTSRLQQFEYQLPAGNGIQHFEARLAANESNEFTIVVRNITRQKQAEETIQTANASLKQRIDELSILNYIIQTVASVTDLDTTLNTVSKTITTLFSAHGTGIILFSFGKSKQTLTAYHTREEDESGSAGLAFLIIGDSVTPDLINNQQPLLISAAQPHPTLEQNRALISVHNLTCLMFIPLLIRGEMIGYINVNSDQAGYKFTSNQVKLAEMLAGHIAGAIESSRLFDAEQQQRQMAESLRQVATVLNSSLNRENVIAKILEQLKQVVEFDSAGLFLQEGDELVLSEGAGLSEIRIGNRIKISSQNPTVRPFIDRKPYVIGDVHIHPEWELWQGDERIRAWMGVPLLIGNQALGVLTTDSIDVGQYGKDQAQVLQIFANQAAIAIKNAQLFNETQKAKEAAETARSAAEAANQAKSIFLASMSHELRTPLNGILGYTQILKRDHDLTEKQRKGIDIIHRSGEHLLMMINDVLDLSKIEAEKMELTPGQVHFSSFLKTLTEIIYVRAAQKSINFDYHPMSPLPSAIEADETRLRQVLLNLLGNAVKFTEQGNVSLKVGYANSEQWADNNRQPDAGASHKIRFQIEDNGIGISLEKQGEIFLPFHQVGDKHAQAAGTGLGLAISQKLVQKMGGQIQVRSEFGGGSTFWFDVDLPEVPWDAEPAQSIKQEIIGYSSKEGKPLKILVVDDKAENRLVLTGLLEPLGFDLREATNGLEALSFAEKVVPDLILMDLVMPEMDGFEATKQIRQIPSLKNTTVIAISASVFEQVKQKSRDAGCDDYLGKPFQVEELLEKLRIHLHLAWIYNEVKGTEPLPAETEKKIFTPPSRPDLSELHELVLIGDVMGLQEQATKLMDADQTLSTFVLHINQLADNFQLDELQDFIEEYLEDAS